MIGLVLPRSVSSFFTDPYFPHLTQGIASACNQNHYTLSLFLVGTKEDEEQIVPRISRRGLLDGIIFQSGQKNDKLIDRLTNANIPLVVAGRPYRAEGVSYIDVDNINASKIAVEHLINLGYKRIGTITGPRTVGIDRKEGYLQALSEHGIAVNPSLIIEGDFTEASGYEVMKKLLEAKPDAVFASSDIIAIGAIRAVKEAGLRVPEDVAFVGFDDMPITSLADYRLTTVRQPVYQFGVKAVEMLIDMIEHGIKPIRHITLGTEFIVRDSSGASRRK
jgi:LacI family transcriptional regulator